MISSAQFDRDTLLYELALPWPAVLTTVLATVVIYSTFVVILSSSRRRLYGTDSVFEFAIVAVLGAVVGRTALGQHPTLATGIVVLLTLGATRLVIALVRRSLHRRAGRGRARAGGDAATHRHLRPSAPRPHVVMVVGEVRRDTLARLRMPEGELWSRLRTSGVRHPEEVALAIIEPSGGLTVLRAGTAVDPRILVGVEGVDGLPPEVVAR